MSVTRPLSRTTFPSSLKFTVIRPPILDCTCPTPQSGWSGWRTNIPGDKIALMSLMIGVL